ncbi:c-type cytochrome [Sulfurimonas sp.]|uniref:c-type cytochrome n=1 Tax=Sulfurimonas sp. TaxID=2022749 RepID=UPI00261CAA4A|nr:c-type cytochrome [Sulfurimonas sp.]
MKFIFFSLFPFLLFATSDFITPMEYASQLYKNPRGIGCQKCHGNNGEGMLIAKYMHKNRKKSFVAPQINNIAFDEFYKTINSRTKGMPRYFLTKQEIKALYFYLHPNDKKKVKDVK